MQQHNHYAAINQGSQGSGWIWKVQIQDGVQQEVWGNVAGNMFAGRVGNVTRGKQKGVKYIIKVL